jgi:hypothetical protein
VSLFDYELIVDGDGKRLIAFGKFAGRAGLIDFLHGLGRRKNTFISRFMYRADNIMPVMLRFAMWTHNKCQFFLSQETLHVDYAFS